VSNVPGFVFFSVVPMHGKSARNGIIITEFPSRTFPVVVFVNEFYSGTFPEVVCVNEFPSRTFPVVLFVNEFPSRTFSVVVYMLMNFPVGLSHK